MLEGMGETGTQGCMLKRALNLVCGQTSHLWHQSPTATTSAGKHWRRL